MRDHLESAVENRLPRHESGMRTGACATGRSFQMKEGRAKRVVTDL